MNGRKPVRNIVMGGWTLGFWLGCVSPGEAAQPLPGYNADPAETSVSGVSSGAYMAVQFHVAHSARVRGVGAIAGGPYYCAQNRSSQAIFNCMKPDPVTPLPAVAQLVSATEALARSGAIDDPGHLRTAKVWLFSGLKDELVHSAVVGALKEYYRAYVNENNITYKNDLEAGHAMITENYGNPACSATKSPYINDCDYDGAGALLASLYGSGAPLNPPSTRLTGTFIEFDQKEFLPRGNAYAHSLSDSGFAYIPKVCESTACRVHIALHGCQQNAGQVGDAFYRNAGYNPWADTNGIIVLYPQTIPRYGLSWQGWSFWTMNNVQNPLACWDWWGYDGSDYHTKNGVQIKALKGMLDRLSERGPGS
jgi:hypothetical protein